MEQFTSIINALFSFKAYVMLPIIIFLFGIIIRMTIKEAFLSGIKLGVGFSGVFLVFDFFVKNIAPAVEMMIAKRGLDYPVLDVGWPPLAGITWASSIAPITVPLIVVINLVMIAINKTRTIYIDIWNYWHFALLGALLQKTNESFILSLVATALIGVYCIKLSDWTSCYVQRECGLKGITISPLSVIGTLPYAVVINSIINRIPVLKKIEFNANRSSTRFEVFSEPMIIGLLVGLFLGLMAGYDIKALTELCINVAAVMFLLPHCGSLLGKGMESVSVKLKNSIRKFFPQKADLVIAMDSPVIFQNKSVIVTGILLMPIAIIISFLLPGNQTIPLGDLPNLISVMSVTVLVCGSNVFRGIIAGIPVIVGYLLIATHLAPLFTSLSQQVGLDYTRDFSGNITAFTDGGNPIRFWFYYLFKGNRIALGIIPVVLVLFYITWRNHQKISGEL
jgi:PTS system galactitol-specific IIC component